jgi:hypothetical protein
MAKQRREEKQEARIERERYWAHVLLYDHPSRKSFWAFLGFYRLAIIQFGWVMWSCWWTGFSLGLGHTFSFWLNGCITPLILLVTLFVWHTRTVSLGKTHLRNLQDIGRWMRRNGIDQDDPPFWLH